MATNTVLTLKRAIVALGLLLVPIAAHAQGTLTGVVKDTSGAVLPGVTVEAASPVLIEKTRSVVTDSSGAVYAGCNVESDSYGLSICAERSAIFAAVAGGAPRPLTALAVSCIDATNGATPCGACRQVIFEHLAGDAPIHVDGVGQFTPRELLPNAFEL